MVLPPPSFFPVPLSPSWQKRQPVCLSALKSFPCYDKNAVAWSALRSPPTVLLRSTSAVVGLGGGSAEAAFQNGESVSTASRGTPSVTTTAYGGGGVESRAWRILCRWPGTYPTHGSCAILETVSSRRFKLALLESKNTPQF
jgi:hypothetical protein